MYVKVRSFGYGNGNGNQPVYGDAEFSSAGVWIKVPLDYAGRPMTLGPVLRPWSMIHSVEVVPRPFGTAPALYREPLPELAGA